MLSTRLGGKHARDTTETFIMIYNIIHILTQLDVVASCGASYSIEIVSAEFEGKRLLERHRLVNAALVEEMKHIHALSITKAVTPDQWKELVAKKSQQDA